MKRQIFGLASFAVVLASCGGGSEAPKEETEKKVELKKEVCTYQYAENTTVKWTAFKFTEKVGVGGTLDSVSVNAPGNFETPADVLNNLEFEIYTNSVNSKNPERDAKIGSFFFGSMDAGDMIKGKVMEVSGNMREGSLSISLTLNGNTVDQQMKYFVEGKSVTINGSLDLENWNAQGSVESLNNVCKDLHTGEDGVSKLWSTVDIEVVSILGQECK